MTRSRQPGLQIGDRVQIENYSDTGTIVPHLSFNLRSATPGVHVIKWDNTGWSIHPHEFVFPAGKTPAQELLKLASEANEAVISLREVHETGTHAEFLKAVAELAQSVDKLTGAIVEEANQ